MSRPQASLHSLDSSSGAVAATLSIGGRDHRITYRRPARSLEPRYEPFLVAALPIAMARARSLSVDAAISPRLLEALPRIQRILEAWGPDQRLRAVEIAADRSEPPPRDETRGSAAFFTAGVDSFYTVLKHREALDALVYVHGFDVPLDNVAKRRRVAGELASVASALELPLIELETDLRSTSSTACRWGLYHGAALASAAHVLAPHFERVLIPGSYTAADGAWGSHPQLDPLWSTESVELIHDSPIRRVEKLVRLARSDIAMSSLRVCYQDTGKYNCGRCEKCLRTMASLRLLGALERCSTFPDHLSLRSLIRVSMPDELVVALGRQNLELAEALGTDPALAGALRKAVRRNSRRLARRRRYQRSRDLVGGRWRRVRARRRRLSRRLRRLMPDRA